MAGRQKEIIAQLIEIGKRLYDRGLVVGRSGNISGRLDLQTIIISSSGTSLGFLTERDFALIDGDGAPLSAGQPSSETPLHTAIYKASDAQFVIHAHPPFTSAYFAARSSLEPITFETKLYLGSVPVIPQETPTVTNITPVIEALRISNIVVLKNHGVVTIGSSLSEGLCLIEELEAASMMSGFYLSLAPHGSKLSGSSCANDPQETKACFEMFSPEHIQKIVDLANADLYLKEKGQELDLTTQVVIKLDETNTAYKFIFNKGTIEKKENDSDAPFIISGKKDAWRLIFEGRLDPFVATTQGKLKLKGDFGKISKWYAPFNRLFAIFQQVGIR